MKDSKKVFVLTDNLLFLTDLSNLLKENQFQISSTKVRGSQLQAILLINNPDLIILDIPFISDIEILQLVDIRRSLDKPVIVLISNKLQQNMVELVRFGEPSYSGEPMTLDNLIANIKAILNTNQSKAQP